MSENLNKILLKPRFQIDVKQSKKVVLQKLASKLKHEDCKYLRKRSGDHFYIDIPKDEAHIWSPQLQIEILKNEDGSKLKGFFAPKPNIWTFFIFLHFIVAVAFLIFSALTYANYVAKNSYSLWLFMMFFCIVLWFTLYLFGQLGKNKAKQQMNELKEFIKECITDIDKEHV